VPVGTKVGEWLVSLLATKGHEIAERLAVLRDSDKDFDEVPTLPAWSANYGNDIVRIFQSHPTLEPAVTPGNESLIEAALQELELEVPDPINPESVRDIFRSAKRPKEDREGWPAGPGSGRKGEFALALAAAIDAAAGSASPASVPAHIADMLDFLYSSDPSAPSGPTGSTDRPPSGSLTT
jgi:putative ATP-dependent endonuclease of OLD family